jgi:hypothetical protein
MPARQQLRHRRHFSVLDWRDHFWRSTARREANNAFVYLTDDDSALTPRHAIGIVGRGNSDGRATVDADALHGPIGARIECH